MRVDRIAARLGLTKGSFHHHFAGAADYQRQLLARFESEALAAIEIARTAHDQLGPVEILMTIPERFSFDRPVEAAVRGWSVQDPVARESLARVDEARLSALTDLWDAVLDDRPFARTSAMIPYLLAIGASVAHPPPTEQEIADVFALLASFVPEVEDAVIALPHDAAESTD